MIGDRAVALLTHGEVEPDRRAEDGTLHAIPLAPLAGPRRLAIEHALPPLPADIGSPRVLDLSDPLHPTELGHFDTRDPRSPDSTTAVFEGAVCLDVALPRKVVFVADSPRGLSILADRTP